MRGGVIGSRSLGILFIALFLLLPFTVPAHASVFTLDFFNTPAIPIVGQQTIFNATGSSSSAGPIVTYSWSFGDGSSVTNCAGSLGCANATALHTYTGVGTFTVTLTAADGFGGSSTVVHSVFISPVNAPPTASFSVSPSRPVILNQTSFDATSSFDRDGLIVQYIWDFGDGGTLLTANTPIVVHSYDTAAVFLVSLTVIDDGGATGFTSKNVTLSASDIPPVANFTFAPTTPVAGQNVSFNATASLDPNLNGTIASYFWKFGDGTFQSGAGLTVHKYLSPGAYGVILIVTDNSGGTNSTFRLVHVQPGPPQLKVSIASDQTQGPAPLEIVFNSHASGGQGAYTYSWSFGDGQTATGLSPAHSYAAPGTYRAQVNVTDSVGNAASNSTTITVSAQEVATLGPFPAQYVLYGVGGSVAALLAVSLLYAVLLRRGRSAKASRKRDGE